MEQIRFGSLWPQEESSPPRRSEQNQVHARPNVVLIPKKPTPTCVAPWRRITVPSTGEQPRPSSSSRWATYLGDPLPSTTPTSTVRPTRVVLTQELDIATMRTVSTLMENLASIREAEMQEQAWQEMMSVD